MCGLAGILIGGEKRRNRTDLEAIQDIFTRLLVLSEHRGPYATGVALVNMGGTNGVFKAPIPAHEFVASDGYRQLLGTLGSRTTLLMGHTRWPSRGSVLNSAENHPISAPPILLTHNGTLVDHVRHFTRLDLPRTTNVDSELLARIGQRHVNRGGLEVETFLSALAPIEGSMSLALVATTRPDEIVLVKGNMPLHVRLHRWKHLVLYASEPRILDLATCRKSGWEEIAVLHSEALVFSSTCIDEPQRRRFAFRGMAGEIGRHRPTGE